MSHEVIGLGSLEELVLMAVVRMQPDAYGLSVRHAIEFVIDDVYSVGGTYSALARLEKKGFITSSWSSISDGRKTRPRRLYSITDAGITMLERSETQRDLMRNGIMSEYTPGV